MKLQLASGSIEEPLSDIIKYQTITNLLQIMRKGEIVHFVLIGAWQTFRPRGQPHCFVKCAITELF